MFFAVPLFVMFAGNFALFSGGTDAAFALNLGIVAVTAPAHVLLMLAFGYLRDKQRPPHLISALTPSDLIAGEKRVSTFLAVSFAQLVGHPVNAPPLFWPSRMSTPRTA